jgi:hypothetical protein
LNSGVIELVKRGTNERYIDVVRLPFRQQTRLHMFKLAFNIQDAGGVPRFVIALAELTQQNEFELRETVVGAAPAGRSSSRHAGGVGMAQRLAGVRERAEEDSSVSAREEAKIALGGGIKSVQTKSSL